MRYCCIVNVFATLRLFEIYCFSWQPKRLIELDEYMPNQSNEFFFSVCHAICESQQNQENLQNTNWFIVLNRVTSCCKTIALKCRQSVSWGTSLSFFVLADKMIYYIDTSVLLENTPLVKFIRNHSRDSGGVFSISSLVRISMLSLISSLPLKLYLNSLVLDRNIFGASTKVFGNLRKFSENVRQN